jgi:hypothetical protein
MLLEQLGINRHKYEPYINFADYIQKLTPNWSWSQKKISTKLLEKNMEEKIFETKDRVMNS